MSASRDGPTQKMGAATAAELTRQPYIESVNTSLLNPWKDKRIPRTLTFAISAVILGVIPFVFITTLASLTTGLLITFPLALPFAWALFTGSAMLGKAERSRAAALLQLDLPSPHQPLTGPSWLRRLSQRVSSGSYWKEFAYFLFIYPLQCVIATLLIAIWAGSIMTTTLPLYIDQLPGGVAHYGLFDAGTMTAALAVAVGGIITLAVIAPWVTLGAWRIERGLVTFFLGPNNNAELATRVHDLTVRNEAAVDSAESERRRIERDLHDGAQQRLVALAMSLGRAKEQFASNPEAARALVDSAHEDAKSALAEIRDLVRGIHPAVLADRGLDAALSSVVARAALPVDLNISLDERLPAAIEATAYFVVAEAIVNVVKHAQATKATVEIHRNADKLVVAINDNGKGGASMTPDGGLLGLQSRVQAVGGWMTVVSPTGGPTSIMAELPCA